MNELRRPHPVLSFFVLAWLLSGLAWLPLMLQEHTSTGWHLPGSFHFLGSWGPLLAAIIVTAESRGPRALRVLFVRWFDTRGLRGWIPFGLLSPFALFALASVVARLAGAPWPDLAGLAGSAEFPALGFAGFFLLNLVTFGIGEEAGWRGFALPRLVERYSPTRATLLIAAGWLVWHLPGFLYRPGLAGLGVGGALGWAAGLVMGAFVASWLVLRGGGGILPVALWHASLDTVYMSRAMRPDLAAIFTSLFMVWGIAALFLLRRRPGASSKPLATPPALASATARPR